MVLKTFSPKQCWRLRLLPVRALGGVAGSGGMLYDNDV